MRNQKVCNLGRKYTIYSIPETLLCCIVGAETTKAYYGIPQEIKSREEKLRTKIHYADRLENSSGSHGGFTRRL